MIGDEFILQGSDDTGTTTACCTTTDGIDDEHTGSFGVEQYTINVFCAAKGFYADIGEFFYHRDYGFGFISRGHVVLLVIQFSAGLLNNDWLCVIP
jgi:hypothetical protein